MAILEMMEDRIGHGPRWPTYADMKCVSENGRVSNLTDDIRTLAVGCSCLQCANIANNTLEKTERLGSLFVRPVLVVRTIAKLRTSCGCSCQAQALAIVHIAKGFRGVSLEAYRKHCHRKNMGTLEEWAQKVRIPSYIKAWLSLKACVALVPTL